MVRAVSDSLGANFPKDPNPNSMAQIVDLLKTMQLFI